MGPSCSSSLSSLSLLPFSPPSLSCKTMRLKADVEALNKIKNKIKNDRKLKLRLTADVEALKILQE